MDPFERKLRSALETFELADVRLVSEIRILLSGHRDMLLREFSGDGLALARALSDAVDMLLRAWVDSHPAGRGLALLALGGYGRGELSPRSDVDVMVLYPEGAEAGAAELTGPLLAFLWDLGHVVGHSTRSLAGCREAMEQDLATATALLEGRLVSGSRALFRSYFDQVVDPWLRDHADGFIEAKVEEARARHRFYGDSPRILVPNVKESPGGLRDMHVAGWIGLALSGRKDFRVFREAGLLAEDESGPLLGAYSDVHRVRNELHLLTGHRQDVLDPSLREEVARRLGFVDEAGFSAAERFMRHYYRAALRLHRFLAKVMRTPLTCGIRGDKVSLGPGLVAVGREVYPESESAATTPAEALAALSVALGEGLSPAPDLEAAIALAAERIDDATRRDPEVAARFLDLLADERAGHALRLLDRSGFLGEYIPEYGRLSGLAREDPHHQYTVDEHSLRAVEALDELPATREQLRRVARPELLRLALLLHDIGKARAGDHVERGTAMVPDVTDRLALPEEDARLVRFLVKNHLLLTRLADRSPPAEGAEALARAVPDRARLRALSLVTLADVKAVGRKALSGWREAQLDRLFTSALERLSPTRRRPFAERVAEIAGPDRAEEIREHLSALGTRYALEVGADRAALHLDLVRRLADRSAALSHLPGEGWGEVWVAGRDVPGLFARIAGVLTVHDLDILGAHAYTRDDGIALDGFFVTREGQAPSEDEDLWSGIAADLTAAIEGRLDIGARVERHRRRFRPDVPAAVGLRPIGASWSDRISDRHVTIEVTGRDRPGLLHDLARTVSDRGFSIHHAIVATRGPEVTDTFYVTAPEGQRPVPEALSALVGELDRVAGAANAS